MPEIGHASACAKPLFGRARYRNRYCLLKSACANSEAPRCPMPRSQIVLTYDSLLRFKKLMLGSSITRHAAIPVLLDEFESLDAESRGVLTAALKTEGIDIDFWSLQLLTHGKWRVVFGLCERLPREHWLEMQPVQRRSDRVRVPMRHTEREKCIQFVKEHPSISHLAPQLARKYDEVAQERAWLKVFATFDRELREQAREGESKEITQYDTSMEAEIKSESERYR